MIKSSLVSISIILYLGILLISASPFNASTNLFENNSSFTLNHNMQFVYAEHDDDNIDIDDLDIVCFENDDDDETVCFDHDDIDIDDLDIDDLDIDDLDIVCFENDDDDETVCFDHDDDYDNFAFTNSPYRSEDSLFSLRSSVDDHSSPVRNPLPPQPDDELVDLHELKGSSVTKSGRSSDFLDLTNPEPFSKFQDPIPRQPGQPLHPSLPATPSLPPEPAEPHAPLVPPPQSN
jgi:hypothetical protein